MSLSILVFIPAIILSLFHAILFLQSGIDKLTDFKGNQEWLVGHFENSPFKGIVKFLLIKLTFLEMLSGLLSLFAAVCYFINDALAGKVFLAAMLLCTFTTLGLFLGQRVAKDYPGAASLVPYFIVNFIGLVFGMYFV